MSTFEGIRFAESLGFLEYLKWDYTKRDSAPALYVSPAVQKQRVEVARSFLGWWFDLELERVALDLKISDARYARYKDQRDRMLGWMVAGQGICAQRVGLTPELRQKFVEVIHPDAKGNPWRPHTRSRNYLMLSLYIWTGLRLSELLALKFHHLEFNERPPTFLVERTPDDPEDDRWDRPQAKTLGRRITLPSAVSQSLREYVRRVRPHVGNARKHPFVFVAQPSGRPLSKRAVQHALSELTKKYPEFEGKLTIHVLRHCWSDMMHTHLKRQVEAGRVDSEFSKLLFNYLGGWSHSSEQSSKYSLAEIRRAADRALLAIHEEMFADQS